MGGSPWQYVVGVIVTVLVGWLTARGVRYTADRAKEGANRTADVDAQESALQAWQALLEPYRVEVEAARAENKTLRTELDTERRERIEKERADEVARAEAKKQVDDQILRLTEKIELLTVQLREWQRLAKVIARWAMTLRDQVLKLGGDPPGTPEELLTLQAIEDAEKS